MGTFGWSNEHSDTMMNPNTRTWRNNPSGSKERERQRKKKKKKENKEYVYSIFSFRSRALERKKENKNTRGGSFFSFGWFVRCFSSFLCEAYQERLEICIGN
jgi:hypothetical protein